MKNKRNLLLFVLCIFLLLVEISLAAEEEKSKAKDDAKPKGRPPSLVEVVQIISGEAEPMVEFVGTVYYARKSDVAAEVEGVVEQVFFEEGYRVKSDDPLVSLGTDILDTAISATRADYKLVLVELEQAKKELNRREPLYKEGSVSESAYDEYFFKSKKLENRSLSLKASLDRLLLEKGKKKIRAPFDGIVVQKNADRGEWVKDGGMVAVIADDSEVDVIVDVPSEMLQYLTSGREIAIRAGDLQLKGKFLSFVPKGDVATRTFSVKIRLKNPDGLVEGMEARAQLPTASRQQSLLVPRDALVVKFGKNVVFVVEDSKAKMMPVVVQGYSGLLVGIAGPDLAAGQQVVVKGNERLFGGEQLNIRQ
jgi:RND family efflux transporter MFP subunit